METMLILNINPELEEDLVDYLLAQEGITGFTSYPVRGHGMHQKMSLAEQVSGRRKALQIEIFMLQENIPRLIAGLKESVGKGIAHWQQPIEKLGST